jgi:hypothetical protein
VLGLEDPREERKRVTQNNSRGGDYVQVNCRGAPGLRRGERKSKETKACCKKLSRDLYWEERRRGEEERERGTHERCCISRITQTSISSTRWAEKLCCVKLRNSPRRLCLRPDIQKGKMPHMPQTSISTISHRGLNMQTTQQANHAYH